MIPFDAQGPVRSVKKIDTPIGSVFHTGTDEEAEATESLLKRRHRFVVSYCESKGWPTDGAELNIDQIMEIRNQEGWKNP